MSNSQSNSKEESIKDFLKGKKFFSKGIILSIMVFIIVLLAFILGLYIGQFKANYSYRWAENYHQNFGGPKDGFMRGGEMRPPGDFGFMNGHGDFGSIAQINNNEVILRGIDNKEKIIIIDANTFIDRGRQSIKKEDLKIGDKITVIGSPNEQAKIQAKIIRVFPGKIK